MLGITVSKSTVEKYRPRIRKPPSPTWKAFLSNHVKDLVSCDFFTVPTAPFKGLFVFIILAHDRRRMVHVNTTQHPTAQGTAQQIVEAFTWDEAPRYLLRDCDSICGEAFQTRVSHLGIEEVKMAPRSPWQSPYVGRTAHREYPARVSERCDRVQRVASAPCSSILRGLLSHLARASLPRHGHSSATPRSST
jgi:hypothetical protein